MTAVTTHTRICNPDSSQPTLTADYKPSVARLVQHRRKEGGKRRRGDTSRDFLIVLPNGSRHLPVVKCSCCIVYHLRVQPICDEFSSFLHLILTSKSNVKSVCNEEEVSDAFGCLSLRWHSAGLSGQKPFPGKRPAPDAAFGSADVIKPDVKTTNAKHILVSLGSGQTRQGCDVLLQPGQESRSTGGHGPAGTTASSVHGGLKIQLFSNKAAPKKTKEQRKHGRVGRSLPPTETSPHSVKAQKGEKTVRDISKMAVITKKSSSGFLFESASPWRRALYGASSSVIDLVKQRRPPEGMSLRSVCVCVRVRVLFSPQNITKQY